MNEQAQLQKALFKKCDEVSRLMKSLSHPTRLKVLCSLIEDEKSVSDLTAICEIPQAGMSQFLKRMKDDSMISSRRQGTFIFYFIADKKLLKLLKAIKDVYCQ